MSHQSIIAVLLSTAAMAASAQGTPSVQEITKKVVRAVSNYQAAISCSDLPVEAKHIAALVPYRSIDDRDSATYAVLWEGDIGCAGGSGTSSFNLAIVRVGADDSFVVDPLRSSPAISLDFPSRGFERLMGNTKDSIVVDAAEYGPNDANCCPSVRFRYTLRVDEKGNWKLFEKRSMPAKR